MTLDAFNERLYEAQAAPSTDEQVRRLTIAVEVLGATVATLEQRIAELDQDLTKAVEFTALVSENAAQNAVDEDIPSGGLFNQPEVFPIFDVSDFTKYVEDD